MKRSGCFLAVWLILGSSIVAADDSFKPIAVFSCASVDELAADLDYLGSTVQNDKFSAAIVKVLSKATGLKELGGLDKSRPWGAALLTDGLQVVPLAFVPVGDAGKWLAALEPAIGKAAPAGETGLWKIGSGPATGFVRLQNGWAFVAQSKDRLQSLPRPESLLAALPSQYDAALRFNPQDLPESLRTMAIDQIRLQLPAADEDPPVGSAPRSLGKLVADQTLRSLEEILSQCQQVTIGFRVDRAAKRLQVESVAVPLPGSKLAARWKEPTKREAPFAAISAMPACVAVHAGWPLDDSRQASFAAETAAWRRAFQRWLEEGALPEGASRQVVQQLGTTFFDLAAAAAAGGRFDAGLAVQGKSTPFTAVAVLHALPPAAGDRLRTRLAELAKLDGGQVRVRIDEVKRHELRVHSLQLGGLDGVQELHKLFGDDLTLYVAESPRGAFIALGKQSLPAIEALAAAPPAAAPPFSGSVKPGALLSATGQWIKDERIKPIVSLAAANLQKGDPELRFSLEPVGGGLRIRLEAGEGVLRGASLAISLAAIQYLAKP